MEDSHHGCLGEQASSLRFFGRQDAYPPASNRGEGELQIVDRVMRVLRGCEQEPTKAAAVALA